MPRGRPRKDAGNGSAVQPARASKANGNGANLGFEAQLFLAADHQKQRQHGLDASGFRAGQDSSLREAAVAEIRLPAGFTGRRSPECLATGRGVIGRMGGLMTENDVNYSSPCPF
jgi:hypothetical protein